MSLRDVGVAIKILIKWWRHRWMSMIAVAIQSCVASTLVDDGCFILDGCDGPLPCARELESREPAVVDQVPTESTPLVVMSG